MESQIRCKVFPGQFSNEYAVKAEQIGGESFSLFAPIQAVETDENPTRDKAVDGWLKVTIWEQTGDKKLFQKEPHAKAQRRKEKQEAKKDKKTQVFFFCSFPLRLCAFA